MAGPKTIFICGILILFSASSFCQKIRFTNSTNFWHITKAYVSHYDIDYSYYDHFYNNDTDIGGNLYRMFAGSGSCVREDTIKGIVYTYNSHTHTDDTLYNYKLQVTDTIKYSIGGNYYCIDRVDNVDSVLINGIYHKRFVFSCTNCYQYQFSRDYSVIEGIGCLSGPLFVLSSGSCMDPGYVSYYLSCFSENNTVPEFTTSIVACSIGPQSITNKSTCWELGTGYSNAIKDSFCIYPNPMRNDVSFIWQTMNDTSVQKENAYIRIFNSLAQVVYDEEDVKEFGRLKKHLYLDIPPGMYYLRLSDGSGNTAAKKIVVTDL